jgi:group I intron endonuclease
MIGIYKITSPSGKIYIGQSQDIKLRFYYYSIASCFRQRRLYHSLKKYGSENHIFEIIEECSIDELNKKERYYQELYDVIGKNGLNCIYQGTDEKRKVISDIMKEKISFANKGSKNGMYGVKKSEEQKQARRDYKHTPESLEKIGNSSRGGNNAKAKLVLDLNTGIFYYCVGDAAFVLGLKRDTLKQRLNGIRKNKTSYIYA